MYTNQGRYCCDTFEFTSIQFNVAIQQAKAATGEATGMVGVEAIKTKWQCWKMPKRERFFKKFLHIQVMF